MTATVARRLFTWGMLVFTAAAADPPPVTITPQYSLVAVDQSAPKDTSSLGKLVASAIAGPPDPKAYYITHRMTYDLSAGVLQDDRWYLYYQPWEKPGFWEALDDPLGRGNYKRNRIYGSNNLHLVPVIVMPSANFANADANARQALEIQAARAIATAVADSPAIRLRNALGNMDDLAAAVGNWRHTSLMDSEKANPAAILNVLQGLHLVIPVAKSPYVGIDVVKGDQLARSTAQDLKLTDASQGQVLKSLSSWIVRELLIAYSQNQTAPMASVAQFTWKVLKQPDAALIAVQDSSFDVNRTVYMPAGLKSADDMKKGVLPHYKVTYAARIPQPLADFQALLGLIGGAQGGLLSLQIDPDDANLKSLFTIGAAYTADARMPRSNSLPVDVSIDAISPADDISKQDGTGDGEGGGADRAMPDATAQGGGAPPPAGQGQGRGTQNAQSSTALSSVKSQNRRSTTMELESACR